MSTYKEIVEKIKNIFSTDAPTNEPQIAANEADLSEKITQLENKIKDFEKILEGVDLKLKEKENEVSQLSKQIEEKEKMLEELSKQVSEKDKKIEELKVELSKAPSSEPIILEKQTKQKTFAEKMESYLKSRRKELGLE